MAEKRRLKRALTALRLSALGLLIVVSLTFIAFYILLYSYDIDAQRGKIENYLSKLIDRRVSINGGLELQASLGSVGIIARDVKVANANWSAQPWFAEAGELEGSISIFDLLVSKIVIKHISLTATKFFIEKSPDGIANWPVMKPGKSPGGKRIIPSILNAEIKNLELVFRIKNRPDLNFQIQSAHAVLPLGEPITIVAEGKYGEIPIHAALRGGTLDSIFKRELNWPIRGTITLAGMDVNVDGTILHSRDLFELALQLRDVKQKPSDTRLYGWQNDGLELLDLNFDLKAQNRQLAYKLQGKLKNLELSYHGEPPGSKPQLQLRIGALKVDNFGAGPDINSIIKNSHSHYEIENSLLIANPANTNKHTTLTIAKMDTRISPATKIATKITAAYNNMPIKATLEHGQLIDLVWSNQPWPYKASAHLLDSQLFTTGSIANRAITGRFKLGGNNFQNFLANFTNNSVGLGKFQLSGKYTYKQNRVDIKTVRLQLADSILNGEISVLTSSTPKLSFSFETKKLALEKLLKPFMNDSPLELSANTLRATGNTEGKTLQEWLAKLNLAVIAPELSIAKTPKNILLLKDITIDNRESASLSVSAIAISQGVHLTVALHSTPLQSVFNQDAVPVVADVRTNGASLKFEGKTVGLKPGSRDKPAIAGSVTAKLQNLSKVIDRHRLNLPAYKNLSLKAHAAITSNAFLLSKLALQSADMSLAGDLSYQPKNAAIDIHLENSHLDIAELLAAYGPGKLDLNQTTKSASGPVSVSQKQPVTTDTQRIIPDKKINVSRLNKLNVNIDVSSLKLTYRKVPVNQVSVNLRIHDGFFDFSYAGRSPQIGSDAKLNLSLFTNLKPPRLELRVDANNLNYGDILKTLKLTNAVSGVVNIDVDLMAEGDTTRELLKSAKGDIAFVSEAGRVPRKLLELWGAGFLRILLPTTWIEEDSTQLNCAVGYFKVSDGYLKSEALLADTERVTVAGDMAVNLLNENIKGLITTKSKSAALFKLATPIEVSGTIKHPQTAPAENKLVTIGKWLIGLSDPYAMILLFGDLGADNKNPCSTLLKITEENEEPKE